MANFYPQSEISKLGEYLAFAHFAMMGHQQLPIDPELIATKHFGLQIFPQHKLMAAGVRSGIDTSQSIIFIDHDTYMSDRQQHLARQGIAHELGHAIFDGPIIRQMSAASSQDAFQLHELMVEKNPGIESRSNMLSGAMLVPRSLMLQKVAELLFNKYDEALALNPNITLETIFEQMASTSFSRYFGVSDDVIGWRFKDEALHNDFAVAADAPLASLNKKKLAEIAGLSFAPPSLPDRVLALLPSDLQLSYNIQMAT